MKKLIYSGFLFALMLAAPGVADAASRTLDRLGTLRIKNSNEYLYPSISHKNGDTALICGGDKSVRCSNGVMIYVTGAHYHGGEAHSDSRVYRCNAGGASAWYGSSVVSAATKCTDSTDGMQKIMELDGRDIWIKGKKTSLAGGSYTIVSNLCFTERGEVAEETEKKSEKTEKKSEETEKNTDSKKDKAGAKVGSGVGSSSRNTNVNAQREASCKNSGGRWSNKKCICDDAFGLTMGGDDYTCRCKNGYEWKNSADKAQGCQMTSIEVNKKKCESAAAQYKTSWTGTDCLCPNDAQGRPQEFDYTLVKCVMSAKIAQCEKVQGAVWNNLSGECVCVQPNFVINAAGTACEESSASKEKREAAELAKTKGKIKTAYDAIGALSNAKKTVWRDAEGEFNTARLASDSIAGVVLGTTGALVTSHLVKKKQAEDGFEDIQCTIGGQTVAGWGDEFSVGINK